MSQQQNPDVYTPLGRGKIVHRFPDGSVAVEFPHGGGQVFRPDELYGVKSHEPAGERGSLRGRRVS